MEIISNGKRIVRKAKTQQELDRKIRLVQQTITSISGVAEPGPPTFGQIWDEWLDNAVRPLHSPNTILSYEAVGRNHLDKLMGIPAVCLESRHLQQIVNSLKKQGLKRQPGYVLEVAHRCLAFGVRQGLLTANIAASVERPRSIGKSTKILRPGQIELLVREMESRFEQNRLRYFPLLWFVVNTGLRISEAIGLRWPELEKGEDGLTRLVMRHQLLKQGRVWEWRPVKSHSVRSIALSDDALYAVQLAALQIGRDRQRAGSAYEDNLLVFPDEQGQPVHRTVPYHSFVDLQRSLGISETFSVHELRHTYLSYLARNVKNLRVVQAVAGHKSLRTTERYLHVLDEDVDQAMTQLSFRKGSAFGNTELKANSRPARKS